MSIFYLNDLNSVQMKLAVKCVGGNHLPHYCLPRLNLYHQTDGIDFRDFPLKCDYPQPIYMEQEEYSSLLNHPHSLVRQKHNFKERLAQLKKKIMSKNKGNIDIKLGKQQCSGNFQLFVELLKQDPDKYFDGPYDWYYTGGNLTYVPQDNTDQMLLLSVTGKKLDRIRVSQQPQRQSKIIDLETNSGIIYETNNYKGNYTVRQKNQITGFCHRDSGNLIDLHKSFVIDSSVPLLSSTHITDCKIATIDADQNINVRDVKSPNSDQSNKIEIKHKIDNWGYLVNFNESLVLYSNRKEFNILDIRVPDYKTISTYVYDNSYECSKIYSMANSKFDNLVYISTNHAIYGLDIRCLPETLSMTTVCKWTHLMKLPPIMIDSALYKGDEYIYLSNSLKDNKKICVNQKNTVYSSPYLPYTSKSIGETYRHIQMQGKCIDPISDFGERINLCTTGISIFVSNDILHTISSNAGGDIFHQTFGDTEHETVPIDIIKNIEKWVHYLRTHRCSKITNMDQMSSILLAMKCKRLSLESKQMDDNDITIEECRRRKPKWQRTVNELYQYKDVLAKNILDVWDIKMSPGYDYSAIQLDSQIDSTQLSYSSKIDEWLTRNDDIEPILDSANKLRDGDENEQDSKLLVAPPDELPVRNEDIEMSQIFKTKRPEPKRKSTRVDGF